MMIRHRCDGEVHILSISGHVTIEDADEFDGYLDRLLSAGATKVVFDCAEVVHIVSATVGSLLGVRERLKGTGGRACIANLSQAMERISQQMSITRFFDVHPDVDTAVKALAS